MDESFYTVMLGVWCSLLLRCSEKENQGCGENQ